MEAMSNIEERKLDLILTSPGGSPEAAEAIMGYLRTRFDHIRAVVPVAAMSAATMMALACDEILMGTHSQLGPIDPQFTLMTPEGPRSSPGQAIIDQFEMAKTECQDPRNIGAWLPLLRSLTPGLIAQCIHSRDRAEEFVAEQLGAHMLEGNHVKAKDVAKWFADFSRFKSHGRPVTVFDAQQQGLKVTRLEDDQTLQDLVLSVHHATRHTFNDTGTTKLIENHHGRAYLQISTQVVVPGPPTGPQPPGPQPAMNRERRRQQQRQNKKKGRR
ncbi:MAG: serine protease [bacterium]|nr:serine protease [bacterium]